MEKHVFFRIGTEILNVMLTTFYSENMKENDQFEDWL
jgi:hypothetical protein